MCILDFSQSLLDDMPSQADRQTLLVYSIVNTLGNLESVDSVLFQVEGAPLSSYGAVKLSAPLAPDFGLWATTDGAIDTRHFSVIKFRPLLFSERTRFP